ncbi:hypothetical protein MMC19_001861 [Ptychographa xylographoides]|nr:hypothetical protein [Ptychographa xylographoides]
MGSWDTAFHTLIRGATVPKNRRPKFELKLKIIDLNNVPLVSGTSYIKWHLPSSASAEHRGRTLKAIIKDHKVHWDYEKKIPVKLTVDKNGLLQDFEINFEVLQEYSSGARGERILLGNVKLNLAEYVEGSDDSEDGITRRYLMQDSKINSTLKTSILMKQIDGDRNFTTPPLKTAPVFGGIAGIMTSEQGDPDDLGHMPSMSSKTRELGELQDMYRKTLAASWTCRMGELPADECIENIFAGGDGWSKHSGRTLTETLSSAKSTEDSTGDAESGAEMRHPAGHHRRTSSGQVRHNGDKHRDHKRKESKNNGFSGPSTGIGGRTSIESVRPGSREKQRTSQRQAHEIDEFEAREDLRSWEISVRE